MLGLLTCVRNVGGPHDPADLLHALEVGAEAAVAAEDLLVHDGGDGQTVETVREGFPQLDVVTSLACRKEITLCPCMKLTDLTFVVESINPVDAGTLVVPSQQEEILGILDLVRQQQANSLQTLLPWNIEHNLAS